MITEKGVSDLAQHYFVKAGITAFRRLRKTDQNRIARATGAVVVTRTDEIQVRREYLRIYCLLSCHTPIYLSFCLSTPF